MLIKIVKRDQKEALSQLRFKAYQRAVHFKLQNTDFLAWSEDDLLHPVLVVEENGVLISTARIRRMDAVEEMEKALDCRLVGFDAFPALVGEKFATVYEQRGRGLAAVLRYLAYRNIPKSKIESVGIIINEGAKRIKELEQMGFAFTEADISNRTINNDFQPFSTPLLGILRKEDFIRKKEKAKANLKTPLESFEIEEGLDDYLLNYMNV